MSQMLAEIKRIVNEDVSTRITQYEVIYEAITNAIHANATKVTCLLQSNDLLLEGQEADPFSPHKLDNITVTDNGDGMNDDNYKSFCKYRSEYKKQLGCKGVGRFIYLKVYKDVHYTSRLVKERLERTFTFNFDFDTDNTVKQSFDPEALKLANNETIVSFDQVSLAFKEALKNHDRRIDLNLEEIRDSVLRHLIPTLYFYKKRERKIEIELRDNQGSDPVAITMNDVPNFSDVALSVYSRPGIAKDFVLHYHIGHGEGKVNAYYCGNNRTVGEFADQDLKINLPHGYSGYFLLEGDYLDSHVNNDRNDFGIFPVKTDVHSPLSWEMINDQLKKVIADLVNKVIPDAAVMNREKLGEILEERPYLTEYIEKDDTEMAGFLDKKEIIDRAKKRFDAAKENVLANSGKTIYTDSDLDEAIQLAQNELVAYVFDRAQVIERLKSLIQRKERVEKVIHNLFMKKKSEDDYFQIGKNNLWLLDDRFTSYSYAASDRRIQAVLKELGEDWTDIENGGDAPDLSLFFSHNPDNRKSLKSVVVEIKPFDFASKSDRKKYQGVQQLVDYVKAFKLKENIEEIWAYLLTDVDAKLAERLKNDDYTPLFSTVAPIHHRFYKELGISIYVIDVKTLVSDAEARNRIFLDIIRKKSRLNEILNPSKATASS